MKKFYLGIIVLLFLFTGCADKFHPAFTFKTESDVENKDSLDFKKHSTSHINAKLGSVIRLNLDSSYIASDNEHDGTKEIASVGNREILVYAKIYKNGQYVQYKNLVNIAEHMWLFNPAVINDKNIFTETINDYYRIELKIFEIDTPSLIKALRFVKGAKLDELGGKYAPGDSFMTGFKEIIIGFFDSVSGLLSGRTVDDLVALIGSDPLFEHSIYISPAQNTSSIKGLLLVGGNGSDTTTYNIQEGTSVNNSNQKTYTKINTDFLSTIEASSISKEDIRQGKVTAINKFPYLFITVEELVKK